MDKEYDELAGRKMEAPIHLGNAILAWHSRQDDGVAIDVLLKAEQDFVDAYSALAKRSAELDVGRCHVTPGRA